MTKSIRKILLESGHSEKRIYRVSDLRKFSAYAEILGYKDDKRHTPEKLLEFILPRGWPEEYYLVEKPVLPHGADRKLSNAKYILDSERCIPSEIQEAVDQAIFWEITEFRTSLAANPIN